MSSTCPEHLVVVGEYGEYDLGQCDREPAHDPPHRMWGLTGRGEVKTAYTLEWDDEGNTKWTPCHDVP